MNYANETIKQLMERTSTRVYSDQEIAPEIKEAILLAACNAPTAGNQQLYTIIDVTDQSLKEKLVDSCDHQPFIAEAKMVLVFCADCKKWYEGFLDADSNPRNPGVGDLLLAVSDTNIAAQNAVTAAESFGIGSCYIGDIMENCEMQRELLGLPRYVFPAAMIVFGYPKNPELDRKKPQRAPLDTIVSQNQYPKMDAADRKRLFERDGRALEHTEWMKAFCERKYNSDFARELSRSVAEFLKDFE